MLPCAGIAANAGFAGFHVEDAETAQLDAFAAAESILHRLKNGFNCLLGFGASDVGFLNYCVDDIELNHTASRKHRKAMLDRDLQVVKRGTL